MKLSEEQKNEVGNYLLDWDLTVKEFFEEIYDHFIEDIEAQMAKGSDYENSFANTTQKFAYHQAGPWIGVSFEGPRALEYQYLRKQTRNNFRNLISFLFSIKSILIALLSGGIYLVFDQFSVIKVLFVISNIEFLAYIFILFNKHIIQLPKLRNYRLRENLDFQTRRKKLNSILGQSGLSIFLFLVSVGNLRRIIFGDNNSIYSQIFYAVFLCLTIFFLTAEIDRLLKIKTSKK